MAIPGHPLGVIKNAIFRISSGEGIFTLNIPKIFPCAQWNSWGRQSQQTPQSRGPNQLAPVRRVQDIMAWGPQGGGIKEELYWVRKHPWVLYSLGSIGKIPGGIQCLPRAPQLMEKCWEQSLPLKKSPKEIKSNRVVRVR